MEAASDRSEASAACGIEVQHAPTDTTLRIVVSGEIDLATAPLLREEIEQTIDRDVEIVVLDFRRVTFMDSTGLHALIDAHEQLNGRLRIMPSPPVARLIEITDLRDQLPVINSANTRLSRTVQPADLDPPGGAAGPENHRDG
jgi:anti-sigma B factor antagonist